MSFWTSFYKISFDLNLWLGNSLFIKVLSGLVNSILKKL